MLQILLFGVMAVEIKRKAPRAHTVLELVRKRWGHVANIVRPCFHFPIHLTCATSMHGVPGGIVSAQQALFGLSRCLPAHSSSLKLPSEDSLCVAEHVLPPKHRVAWVCCCQVTRDAGVSVRPLRLCHAGFLLHLHHQQHLHLRAAVPGCWLCLQCSHRHVHLRLLPVSSSHSPGLMFRPAMPLPCSPASHVTGAHG